MTFDKDQKQFGISSKVWELVHQATGLMFLYVFSSPEKVKKYLTFAE